MDNNSIVESIKKDSLVEKAVYKMLPSSKNPFDYPKDLCQDVYVILLEKDNVILDGLYQRGELPFYILKIVKNQLLSANSRYYYTYIKFQANSDDLEKAAHIFEEDRRRVC